MKAKGSGQTDIGRERERNEDAFFADDELGLYIVSDGMGGHAAGDVASQTAVEAVVEALGAAAAPTTPQETYELLSSAIQFANGRVYDASQADAELRGMGCTLTLLFMSDGYAAVAHVGDSRCYLWRDGEVSQLTKDHTVASELVEVGAFSHEEADASPFAHALTRAVGVKPTVEADTFGVELEPDDHLLLCSDGLTKYLPSMDWLAHELEDLELEGTARRLIDFANAQGGADNITAVVVTIDGDAPSSGRATSYPRRLSARDSSPTSSRSR